MTSYRGKRLLDLVIGIPALILSLPVQAAVAVAVARKLGRPVLFHQVRPGLGGKPFELVKFRTMLPIDVTRGWTDDESRMTALGRTLRATSLDELPTLWNVLRGDMSLVGPRPLLMQYVSRYTPIQARRQEVPPGMTGLAQVPRRNAISWDERFALDVHYVDSTSLHLDLRIMLSTIRSVLKRENISAPARSTMPEFIGTHSTSYA